MQEGHVSQLPPAEEHDVVSPQLPLASDVEEHELTLTLELSGDKGEETEEVLSFDKDCCDTSHCCA